MAPRSPVTLGPDPGTEPTAAMHSFAVRLSEENRRVSRLSRRAVRRSLGGTPLTMSQAEVLQLVAEHPGVGVTQAAEILSLATNTVSTIATHLLEAGLVRKEVRAEDRRCVGLAITPSARKRMASWRDRRAEVLARVVSALSPPERDALAAALPVLARVADLLEGS